MKRVFAIILALALVLSLSITAFAAEEKGSITITNATIGQTYNLFKIFDATYAIGEDGKVVEDANGDAIVSYTITPDSKFFTAMFGADGTASNDYFIYEAGSGVVTKRAGVSASALFEYLDTLVSNATADASIPAKSDTVVFENIDTGYYLIDRGVASTVTLTSNMPDARVIDKNQKPNDGDSFTKLVYDEDLDQWVKSSTANVGDIIDWTISFDATNYDGDDLVLYYCVRDIKSSSLWVEFDDIKIKVGDKELTKGYYYCANNLIDTDEWNFLGNGWDKDDEGRPTGEANDAEWYLIHYDYDMFEIVIPWVTEHNFTGVESASKGYDLTFPKDEVTNAVTSTSLYDSPSKVVMEYSAAVGPTAANSIAKNSATLDWITPEGTFGPEDPETTETKVYNLGITKIANDGTATTAATRLAGAVFELYQNYDAATKTYSNPIYVIPTNNEGVYILDDVDTIVSGEMRTTARELYEGHWETWIEEGTMTVTVEGNTYKVRNDVETPENGQVVVLGLEAGTYYLKETKAPEGYNKLVDAFPVTVGSGSTAIYDNGYTNLDNTSVTFSVYSAAVENNRGFELPSTGGQGTMMLITFGTMIAIAFAVLLITQKKMTVYHD